MNRADQTVNPFTGRTISPSDLGAHPMVEFGELKEISGLEVSAVCYVRDYVEIHFDGPVLRLFSEATLLSGEGVQIFDALRGLIGQKVSSTLELQEEVIIDFANDASLHVPRRSRTSGPEVMHFVPADDKGELQGHRMSIWENLESTRPHNR